MKLSHFPRRLLPAAGIALAGTALIPVMLSTGASAATAQPARAAAPAAAAATAGVAASATCTNTVKAVGNGVRIRTAPNLSSAVVGQAYSGQKFTADCYTVVGAKYTACGFTEDYWMHLKFEGDWRYSAAACYTVLN